MSAPSAPQSRPPSPKAPPVPPNPTHQHRRNSSSIDVQKPLPPPPRTRSFLWTVVVPLTIAVYLAFLYSWIEHNRPPPSNRSRYSGERQCDPKSNPHCWGVDSPYGLRGQGIRDRTQLGQEKATLLMLVRNRELEDALEAMKQIEDRFNRHYRYPWTFLNDEPFTEQFKNYTSIMASGEIEFGQLGSEEWGMPEWISEEKFRENAKRMEEEEVLYGGSKTYRNMCRWFSGWFWRHPLMMKYDWYWRVEPNTRFYCDQLYDPFTYLRTHNKSYSFALALPEYPSTIPSLFSATQSFFSLHPEYLHPQNSLGFVTDSFLLGLQHPNTTYNFCHFWSNFEIASLSFFRSDRYKAYFDYLDREGGFYYERWGDAPVHTLAVALMLGKDEIHFWEDVGYWHEPWGRCPWDADSFENGRCAGCPWVAGRSFDWHEFSCLGRWWQVQGLGDWWQEFSKFDQDIE